MKLHKLALATVLFAPMSFNVMADVALKVPENIRLLVVNEMEVNKGWDGFFKSGPDALTLKNGKNQIVYQIDQFFYKGETQSQRIRSTPYVVTFTASDTTVKLEIPHFDSIGDAKIFEKNPRPILLQNNQPLAFQFDRLKIGGGLNLTRDYAKYVEQYNRQGGNAAITITASTASTASTAKITASEKTIQAKSSIADQNLRYWFKEADEKTKKEFLSWAVQHM